MNNVIIIAEAGVNHNGSIELAKKMVDVAVNSKVDYIKFQTAKLDNLVSKYAKMSEYQIRNIGKETSQKEMLNQILLSFEDFEEIFEYCQKKRVKFLSTPFDIESIDFLAHFNMPFWKVPSGEITNYPYLVHIAKTKKPVVMSCGMSNIKEIRDAIQLLKKNGTSQITVLHCNTDYPTAIEDANLNVIPKLREELNLPIGYSDHTLGMEVPIAAVALGATVIEKHFTLNRNMEGPDHKCSLEPEELKELVKCIRNTQKALGENEKIVTESEKKNIIIARKSIVCAKPILAGQTITEENITTKRPGNGINPMKWKEVLGKKANRSYNIDEMIDKDIIDE